MDTITSMPSQSDGLIKERSTFYNLTHSQSLYNRDASPAKTTTAGGQNKPFGYAASMEDLEVDEDQVIMHRGMGRTAGDGEMQVLSADAVRRMKKKKSKGNRSRHQMYTSEPRVCR